MLGTERVLFESVLSFDHNLSDCCRRESRIVIDEIILPALILPALNDQSAVSHKAEFLVLGKSVDPLLNLTILGGQTQHLAN